jgi:succinate dehydrogenase hydrophobic anchor subunit
MVEYHGWITLRESTHDIDDGRLDAIAATIQGKISGIQAEHTIRGMKVVNATYMIWLGGCTNHWSSDEEEAFELFRFVASLAPGSYGLLYVWDDEAQNEQENMFRVWRLARGFLTQHADPFLSPCIPTLEDPYDPQREA